MASPTRNISVFSDGSTSLQASSGLWRVLGDEELARYNFKSRTQTPDWAYLPVTPSVFRFNRIPAMESDGLVKDTIRVDISPLVSDILRLNDYDENTDRRLARLYSGGTALFNGDSFPRMQYLVMSGNVLEEISVENGMLKFKTVTPQTNVSNMTRQSHPQFVMRWDLVTFRNGQTLHMIDRYGDIFWFLCSDEGYGYIPLEFVRRL